MVCVLVDHLDLQHGIHCALKCLKRYGRWRTEVFDLLGRRDPAAWENFLR